MLYSYIDNSFLILIQAGVNLWEEGDMAWAFLNRSKYGEVFIVPYVSLINIPICPPPKQAKDPPLDTSILVMTDDYDIF